LGARLNIKTVKNCFLNYAQQNFFSCEKLS
jgi:hypothetical protein